MPTLSKARQVATLADTVVSVKDFGAVGDGVTDDTAAIQAAIDAAVNELHFEDNKTYRISSSLNINNSNRRIYGRGATLDGSAQPASVSLNDRYALKIEGTWGGSAITVSGALAEGAMNLTVSNTSTLAVGDLVLVYSTSENFPSVATANTTYKGSLHRIRSIDSATALTLRDGVLFDYVSTTNTRIRKISPVENVLIDNLKVVMGGLNKAHSGIRLGYGVDLNLVNCYTDQTEDTGVFVEYVFGGSIQGGAFTNCNSPGDGSSGVTGNTGYGVCPATATRDFEISSAYFTGCRHAVAGGGSYPPAYIIVSGNHVAGGRSPSYGSTYQLDCHEDCIYWTFVDNHVNACNLTNGTASGIQVRGQKTKVLNNTITNAHQHGILVQNYDNPSVLSDVVIHGNLITAPRLTGISVVGTSAAEVFDVIIKDNKIHSPDDDAIIVWGATRVIIAGNQMSGQSGANKSNIRFVGTATTAGNCCRDVVVIGNTSDAASYSGVRADYLQGGVIAQNNFENTTVDTISLTNCTEVAVIGNNLSVNTAFRSAVAVATSTRVSVSGGVFKNNATPSSDACGVYITGTSTDVAVTGITPINFRFGVKSVSPANYITVAGINARTCTVSSVDVTASANTAVAGNL